VKKFSFRRHRHRVFPKLTQSQTSRASDLSRPLVLLRSDHDAVRTSRNSHIVSNRKKIGQKVTFLLDAISSSSPRASTNDGLVHFYVVIVLRIVQHFPRKRFQGRRQSDITWHTATIVRPSLTEWRIQSAVGRRPTRMAPEGRRISR